jgi:hypothetical protein
MAHAAAVPIVLAWAVSNAWTDSARALTGAMITGTGAIGSITSRVLHVL